MLRMKKTISLLLTVVIICVALVGCSSELNSGEDILYKDIVYKRTQFPNFNIEILEDSRTYIGDFAETYAYGQQLYWEVFTLNDAEDVLYSQHAVWIRPGYVFPDEYGEEFSKAEYVVSEGILDTYKEETTPLVTFDSVVKLEDIIEAESTPLTEYTSYERIRFYYKNHPDMTVFFYLFSHEGVYYLSVCEDNTGNDVFFKIKPEYVSVLTSVVADK